MIPCSITKQFYNEVSRFRGRTSRFHGNWQTRRKTLTAGFSAKCSFHPRYLSLLMTSGNLVVTGELMERSAVFQAQGPAQEPRWVIRAAHPPRRTRPIPANQTPPSPRPTTADTLCLTAKSNVVFPCLRLTHHLLKAFLPSSCFSRFFRELCNLSRRA